MRGVTFKALGPPKIFDQKGGDGSGSGGHFRIIATDAKFFLQIPDRS